MPSHCLYIVKAFPLHRKATASTSWRRCLYGVEAKAFINADDTIVRKCRKRGITNFDLKKFRKIMKGLNWALYYDSYHGQTLDAAAMGKRISQLLRDGEIQHPQGIIPYVLTGDERSLDLRAFPEDIKLAVYEEQHHRCAICGKEFDYEFMEGDHIASWCEGGRTVKENCQMLCRNCNRRKGAK